MMALDTDIIGHVEPTVEVRIDAGRLAAFADAIGEANPIYRDRQASVRAGYPDVPVPLTYAFSLGLQRREPLAFLEKRGVELLTLLHGEQRFVYHRMAFAGETLFVRRRVLDFYERRNGELQFVVIETQVDDPAAGPVTTAFETLVLPRTRRESKATPAGRASTTIDQAGLAPLRCGTVTEEMLARFSTASGDLNRVHLDRAAAASVGYEDVFAQGMLSMAWLGRLLTGWTRQENVLSFGVRFHAVTPLRAEPVCEGWISQSPEEAPGGRRLGLHVRLDNGVVTVSGDAIVAPSEPQPTVLDGTPTPRRAGQDAGAAV
jgi:acyl dehydratase